MSSEFLSTLDEGDAKAATLDDGTRLGKVFKVRGRLTPAVTNEAEFLAWVRKNHPSEITESVRPAYQAKVIASTKANGLPVDPATGEVVPGVELREGAPYISFRGERGYQEIIAQRWTDLVGPSLLEAGGE